MQVISIFIQLVLGILMLYYYTKMKDFYAPDTDRPSESSESKEVPISIDDIDN